MSGYNDDTSGRHPDDQFDAEDQFDDLDGQDITDTIEDGDDDGWDDDAVEQGEQEQQNRAKKKSNLVAYGLIGVIVVAGLGFGAMALMGGGSAPDQTGAAPVASAPEITPDATGLDVADSSNPAVVIPMETPPQPAPETPAQTEPSTPAQGFLNNPAELEAQPGASAPAPADLGALPTDPAAQPAEPAAVASSADSVPSFAAPSSQDVATSEAPAVIGGLKPVSDFPSADQIKKAVPDTAAPLAAPEGQPQAAAEPVQPEMAQVPASATAPDTSAADPVPAAPAAAPVNTAEVTALQEKLDAALARIKTLEADAQTVKANAQADADAKVRELEAKIARLETGLAQKSQSAPAVAAGSDQAQPAAVLSSPATTQGSADAQPRRSAAASSTVVRTSWELRSAQPGKAMIARKGQANDLRSVSVGDTVPGLGKIQAIEQGTSGWVVRGTLGRVTQ